MRGVKRKQEETQQIACDLPRTLPVKDHERMRTNYEDLHGSMTDTQYAAYGHVKSRLQRVEDGKLKAEKLKMCYQWRKQAKKPHPRSRS